MLVSNKDHRGTLGDTNPMNAEGEQGIGPDPELTNRLSRICVTRDATQGLIDVGLKYQGIDTVQPQLAELMSGFLEVFPHQNLLSVFNPEELEQVFHGCDSS